MNKVKETLIVLVTGLSKTLLHLLSDPNLIDRSCPWISLRQYSDILFPWKLLQLKQREPTKETSAISQVYINIRRRNLQDTLHVCTLICVFYTISRSECVRERMRQRGGWVERVEGGWERSFLRLIFTQNASEALQRKRERQPSRRYV